MKSKDFEQVFNKNVNKKQGSNNNSNGGLKLNSNRAVGRSHTLTQNKGGGNKTAGK